MTYVVIDGGVVFAPNIGVMLRKTVRDWPPVRLHDAVRRAYSHMDDRYLIDACCSGCGPLADCGEVTYEMYLDSRGQQKRPSILPMRSARPRSAIRTFVGENSTRAVRTLCSRCSMLAYRIGARTTDVRL